ncbi:MAG TPA: long-chain-fatty-acid--CoA ligase [Pseudonocardiaceae bacterium]|jgi:long-chain acyl-CoA synthetase
MTAFPTLRASMRRHAEQRPAHPALVCQNRVLDYAGLDRYSDRLATTLLAAGAGDGGRVAHFARDSEHYYALLVACAKAGAVLVPIDWRLTPSEVEHILTDSTATLLFTDPAAQPVTVDIDVVTLTDIGAWAESPAVPTDFPADDPERPLVQIYTSGTTGAPKGVVLAQRTFSAVAGLLAEHGLDWIDWRRDDRSLLGVPGFHVGGVWWAVQGLNAGVTNVVLPAFDSYTVVQLIRTLGITTTCMVPAMLRMLVDEPGVTRADFVSLRKVVYGGSPISDVLMCRCLDTFDCDLAQIYGLTESGNTAVCLPPADHKPGSPRLAAAGRPYPGIDIRIIDATGVAVSTGEIGQVCLHTPARMLEYWHQPAKTAQTLVAGWVHTGDAGYLDADGYLYICDRITDTIIVAGENIYPAEVEKALCRHPAVADAAVVGAPDDTWGESINAFVVPRAGHDVTGPELSAFLRGGIAGFKVPTRYVFTTTLPRNPSGKILRRTLRDELWSGMRRNVN